MKKSVVTPSAVIVFFVGQRITSLVCPWLTITKRESKLADDERSVMRSQDICWKGHVAMEWIGVRGGTMRCMLDLFCWQMAHSSTYFWTKAPRPGHQNLEVMSW